MNDRSGFESEKEKEDDLQPTKKRRTKPSAPKGKQGTSLKSYRWKTISKGRYIRKIPRTQSGQFQRLNNGLCRVKSA